MKKIKRPQPKSSSRSRGQIKINKNFMNTNRKNPSRISEDRNKMFMLIEEISDEESFTELNNEKTKSCL